MTTPAVSIIIPTYNRAAFLPSAISSVLAQTYRDFELIVVDDGSADGSLALLQDLARGDARIRPVANAGARGPGSARNAGMAQARGEWIAFLDSDDQWEPSKLERFISAAQPGVVMVGSDYRMCDEKATTRATMRDFLFETMVPWWEKDSLANRVIDCARLRADIQALTDPTLMIGMTIGGFLWPQTSSVMVSRLDMMAVGGFDAGLARTEDMDLWLKLLPRGRVAYLDEVLATYNIAGRETGGGPRYEGHDQARRHDAYREARFHLRFLQSMPRRAALDEDARALLSERIAVHHRMCGHAARGWAAARHYASALARSAKQRQLFRADRAGYWARPW